MEKNKGTREVACVPKVLQVPQGLKVIYINFMSLLPKG